MGKSSRVANTSDRLREAMKAANKTQADLVRETGLSKSTLSRYLSGGFEPKQNAIHKLAMALGVSEMWLWGFDVPMQRETKKAATDNGSGQSEAKAKLFALAEECTEEDAERLLQMMELFLGKR